MKAKKRQMFIQYQR